MNDIYTDRSTEVVTVDKVDDQLGWSVTWTNGWSFGGVPDEHRPLVVPGAQFIFETVRFSTVTGMATLDGHWLWHKSDADLEREHAEMVAGFRREHEASWERNRDDWARRESELPHPLRRRLMRFRDNGGHEFEVKGWGYELTVCELAVLYAASGQEDDDAINTYAREHGTSGNQHDCAKMLSRGLADDMSDQDAVANSISALSPLTGDADYSNA